MKASVFFALLALPAVLAAVRAAGGSQRELAAEAEVGGAPAPAAALLQPLSIAAEPMKRLYDKDFALAKEIMAIKSLSRFQPVVGDVLAVAGKAAELAATALEARLPKLLVKLALPVKEAKEDDKNSERDESPTGLVVDALAPVYDVALAVRASRDDPGARAPPSAPAHARRPLRPLSAHLRIPTLPASLIPQAGMALPAALGTHSTPIKGGIKIFLSAGVAAARTRIAPNNAAVATLREKAAVNVQGAIKIKDAATALKVVRVALAAVEAYVSEPGPQVEMLNLASAINRRLAVATADNAALYHVVFGPRDKTSFPPFEDGTPIAAVPLTYGANTIITIFNSLVPDNARGMGSDIAMLHYPAGDVVYACLSSNKMTEFVLRKGGAAKSEQEQTKCIDYPCLADLLPPATVTDAVQRCAAARKKLLKAANDLVWAAGKPGDYVKAPCTNLAKDCNVAPSRDIPGFDSQLATASLRRLAEETGAAARELFDKFDSYSKEGVSGLKRLIVDQKGWPYGPVKDYYDGARLVQPKANPMLWKDNTWARAWMPLEIGSSNAKSKNILWPYPVELLKVEAGRLVTDKIRAITLDDFGVLRTYDMTKAGQIMRDPQSCAAIKDMPEEALRGEMIIDAQSTFHTENPRWNHIENEATGQQKHEEPQDLATAQGKVVLTDLRSFKVSGLMTYSDGKKLARPARAELHFRLREIRSVDHGVPMFTVIGGPVIREKAWPALVCALHVTVVQASMAALVTPQLADKRVHNSCRHFLVASDNGLALQRLAALASKPMLEEGERLQYGRGEVVVPISTHVDIANGDRPRK